MLNKYNKDVFVHERLYGELREHIQTLSGFLSILGSVEDSTNREVINTIESMHESLHFLPTAYEARQTTRSENSYVLLPPPMMTGHQGRPRYSLSGEQISHLVSLGRNWQSIATCLGVSCRTLCRHRHRLGIQPLTFATLSDGNLNRLLLKFFSLPRMQVNDMYMGV